MTPVYMAALMARAMPGARPWTPEEFDRLLARPGAILSGSKDALVIGQAVADEAEIFMVLCAPEKRRQGLATAAIKLFHEQARTHGVTRVILDVAADNTGALALYRALGYRQIAERKGYYPRGESPAISALMLEIAL